MASILVLHSGGLDSTTCLYQAHALGHEVRSLGIEYGQTLFVEMLFARKQCAAKNIQRDVVSLAWQKPVREIPLGRTIDQIKSGPSTAFLPGRNILFLSIACAHGAGLGVSEVHIGLNAVGFSGYPDCTPDFFASYQAMLQNGMPNGPRIVAPLLKLTKPQIATKAKFLGIGPRG